MNTIERHQVIINKIKKEGQVKVLTLCEELKVSSVTIRKDLKFLEDKGFLFRAHGGATLSNPYTIERPVDEKGETASCGKDADRGRCRQITPTQ